MSESIKLNAMDFISESELNTLIDLSFAEDGARDDLTTRLTIPPAALGIAKIRAKQELILCGIEPAIRYFNRFDPTTQTQIHIHDGARLMPGDIAATIKGTMHTLLAVERPALNLLMHLCGIATWTARFTHEVAGTGATILDTRKTIPGFRGAAKYAVLCGGGANHRKGLGDAVLIKDNHAAAAGSVGKAVLQARSKSDPALFIEAEASTLKDLEEAMDAGANRVLLDNMTNDQLAKCVKWANGRIALEASGGVNLETVRGIAQTGVNFISIGALTHSAPAADLNMKIEPVDSLPDCP
jgi:nicotinate-nucleotide pyrophosphorylase (carboxylating)